MDKIYTENIPLVDEVVYYIKLIGETIITKDNMRANANESVQTGRAGDIYCASVEKRARYDLFTYTKKELGSVGIPAVDLDNYVNHIRLIPSKYHQALANLKMKQLTENYIEMNNYYRRLAGLPDYGEEGLYIPEGLKSLIPKNYQLNADKKITDYSSDEQDLLRGLQIPEKMYQMYPQCKYLLHLGTIAIDPYTARRANQFQLLYIPVEIPKEVSSRFIERYEINRVYFLNNVYSDAFKFNNDNYDDFIRFMITLQTMMDVLVDIPDFIIKKDIFDLSMCELMFKSAGIDYYSDIPLKYQIQLVKNINLLVKNKATSKSIVDICSIFGCENVEVFKYYILRDRRKNADGEFINKFKENGEEDYLENYSLRFLKVPIDKAPDDYLFDNSSYSDYDDVTNGDKYWDGGEDHEAVREAIMKHEFNYLETKYLSVDTVFSMSELAFQQTYFYNFVFDKSKKNELLTLKVDTIDTVATFKMTDLICYLYAMMFIDYGIKDNIQNDPAKILVIKGFNFEASLGIVATYLREHNLTLKDVGVSGYSIPSTQIPTYQQMMKIFDNDVECYNTIRDGILNANNKEEYDVFKYIYDALMIRKLSDDFFYVDQLGRTAISYTEYLQYKSPILYESLENVRSEANAESKQIMINQLMGDSIYALEKYINSDKYQYIFSNFPTVSADSIKQYVFKVINFFKSYKMQLYRLNTIYKFDDQLENKIMIIDELIMSYNYTREEIFKFIEKTMLQVHLEKEDSFIMNEKTYFDYFQIIDKAFSDDVLMNGKFGVMKVSLSHKDRVDPVEAKRLLIKFFKKDYLGLDEMFGKLQISLTQEEKVALKEKLYISYSTMLDKEFKEVLSPREAIISKVSKSMDDAIGIYDSISITTTTEEE